MTVREICVRHRAKQHAAVLLDENGVELVTQPSQPPQPPSTPPSPHITSRKRGRRHAVVDDDDDDDDAPAAEVATSVPAAAAAPESGQQYAKLRYTPPTDGERCGEWEGMTVNGVVHAVYRKAFKGTHTQRCADAPGQWIKLPPGNARGDTEPLGSADGCLLPAANRNAPCGIRLFCARSPRGGAPAGEGALVRVQLGGECDHVRWTCGGGACCHYAHQRLARARQPNGAAARHNQVEGGANVGGGALLQARQV